MMKRSPKSSGRKRQTPSRSLVLEQLEDRCVPAPLNSILWIGPDGGSLTEDNNWITISGVYGAGVQIAPTQYDEMVFDPTESVNGVQGSFESPGGSLSGSYDDIYVSPFYPGTLNVAAGNTATITESLDLLGGTISGEGTLTINTALSGGTSVLGSLVPDAKPYLGTSTTTVISGSVVNVEGVGTQGGVLLNYGTIQFLGQGYTTNFPGECSNYGVMDVKGDITFGQAGTGLKNWYIFEKTDGSSTATLQEQFVNYDGFYLKSGKLELANSSGQMSSVSPALPVETQLNGGSLKVDRPYLLLAGYLDGVGTVTGTVDAGDPSGTYTTAGWVHPGFLATDTTEATGGRINITGDLWVASNGGIYIELTNGWSSGVGQVGITGTLTLNGGIVCYRHDNFTPTSGSTNVVTYGSEAGNGGIGIENDIYSVDGTEYRVFGADNFLSPNAWTLWVDYSD